VRFIRLKDEALKSEESVSGRAFLDLVADLLHEQRRRRFQVLTSTIRIPILASAFFGYCVLSVNLNCLGLGLPARAHQPSIKGIYTPYHVGMFLVCNCAY